MNKNLFKKVISILLVIAMMASMGVYASAADETTTTYTEGDLTYTLSIVDDKGVASVVCNNKAVTSVTVPGTITVDDVEYAVTTLGENCFENCRSLTNVVLPDTIITIGETAFKYCISLVNIDLPAKLTTICDNAFSDCYNLASITIPSTVTSIGQGAFNGCEDLEEVTFKEGVTIESIESITFQDCTSLKSIDIPDGVTSIGASAFKECTSLETVIIPDSVEEIENYAFYQCESLTGVELPTNIESIGTFAFAYCSSLKEIEIPENVTILNDSVFENCTSLVSITIYASIKFVGSSNFTNKDNEVAITYVGTQAQWDVLTSSNPSISDDNYNYPEVGFSSWENYYTVVCTVKEGDDVTTEPSTDPEEEGGEPTCDCDECTDQDEDGTCDKCCLLILLDYDFTNGGRCYWTWCDCVCNASTWFGQMIGKMCLYFWELFGIHKWCCCGRMHY